MAARLSDALDDPDAVPYFLWDDPLTVRELRERLTSASAPERRRLLAKIVREARDTDVWRFTSPQELAARWDELAPLHGRRRAFWAYLLGAWRRQGLLRG